MVATRHIVLPQSTPKCFCGRCYAPNPTGEAHTISQTSYVDLAVTSWARGEGQHKKEKKGRRRKVTEWKRKLLAQ